MRFNDIIKNKLNEGNSHPVISVDVQPEYSGINDGDESPVFIDIIKFVVDQSGPVLKFVNAETDGLTGDTVEGIKLYWQDTIDEEYGEGVIEIDWSRFTIVDKGYGYFRGWMDNDVSSSLMIKMIRLLYQNKLTDSRDLFGGEESEDYEESMKEFAGDEYQDWMLFEPFIVNWTSVGLLKKFNGAYIVGGGREECLREVELLMNAFNIKYKRIDSLVYG